MACWACAPPCCAVAICCRISIPCGPICIRAATAAAPCDMWSCVSAEDPMPMAAAAAVIVAAACMLGGADADGMGAHMAELGVGLCGMGCDTPVMMPPMPAADTGRDGGPPFAARCPMPIPPKCCPPPMRALSRSRDGAAPACIGVGASMVRPPPPSADRGRLMSMALPSTSIAWWSTPPGDPPASLPPRPPPPRLAFPREDPGLSPLAPYAAAAAAAAAPSS
mmetsp:Transcript_34993/g.85767  ORF Transcript_34993/g.85767 Transcript_34993/m.85767 type:complete len:223 (-) Transcript_34993:503-1171(-)